MRILVTGGAGFIGSNYIHYIFSTYPDYEIVNLDKLTYAANVENVRMYAHDPRYTFHQGDICDPQIVKTAMQGCDLVVHFAAESHVDRSISDPFIFTKTNVEGTHVLLHTAKELGNIRFHHISTDEVFGSLELESEEQFNENTQYRPNSPYSASKAGADCLVRAYYSTYGLPITISNCGNNYGPYMFPEKFIPLFITNLLEDKQVPLYGDGKNVRDWIHVKDHCRAIDQITHHGRIGETYCIGSDSEKSNVEVTHEILRQCQKGEEMIKYVEDRLGHDRRYSLNSSKIKNELGWRPVYTFEQGLKEMVDWYKGNEAWWKPLKERV